MCVCVCACACVLYTLSLNPILYQDYDAGIDVNLEMTANVGTPVFSAPEIQSDEHSATYSTKVDVFSFGIIIW